MGQGASGGQLEDKYFVQKVKLGQGSFGTVWRAVEKQTQKVVAIKQLDKSSLPRRGVRREDIEREIAMMKAVSHENLTKLFDSFEDGTSIYLALEYCDGGDFGDKVKERGMDAKEPEVAEWMRQICAGSSALHAKSICHRDIKPDNFMISSESGINILKLSDFGLAIFLPQGKLLTEKCGTPAFMAPEQHNLPKRSRGYSFPADVWAAGVSMYMVMFGGRHPFMTDRGQLDNELILGGVMDFRVGSGQKFFGFDLGGGEMRFSDAARNLCTRMVQPDESRRYSFEDCLRCPWIHMGRPPGTGGGACAGACAGASVAGTPSSFEGAARSHTPAPNGKAMPFPVAAKIPNTEMRLIKDENSQLKKQLDEEKRAREMMISELSRQHSKQDNLRREITRPELRHSRSGLPGILPVGMRCRYWSDNYGWMNAVVKILNDDGTCDLDVRPGANWERISPLASSLASDVWSVGTSAAYHSASVNKWLPAVVVSFNESDLTYNLDVRDHADVDRIRARLGDRLPSQTLPQASVQAPSAPEPRAPGRPPLPAPPPLPAAFPSCEQPIVGYSSVRSQGERAESKDGLYSSRPDHSPGRGLYASRTENSPVVKGRLTEGMHCTVLGGHGLAIVSGYNEVENMYTVVLAHSSAGQRMQVPSERLRAPSSMDPATAWPAGFKVCYDSASLGGQWINATIVSASAAGKYNLDVREAAAPDNIRPR